MKNKHHQGFPVGREPPGPRFAAVPETGLAEMFLCFMNEFTSLNDKIKDGSGSTLLLYAGDRPSVR
jgi:hypothetical protein